MACEALELGRGWSRDAPRLVTCRDWEHAMAGDALEPGCAMAQVALEWLFDVFGLSKFNRIP